MSATSKPRWWNFQRLIVLAVIAFVLVAVLIDTGTDQADPPPVPKRTPIPAGAARPPVPTRAPAPDGQQSWLVMVYADADDEILEEDIYNDLNEAELVGSNDRVRIVAQIDRYDGGFDGDGDWTTARRFLVQRDDDLETLHSEEVADLGEVNMADADTLIDFVTWAARTYPADKYVLIMSDHGAGWPGGWNDPDPPTVGRHDLPMAQNSGDMLFLMEIGEALDHILAKTAIGQFELIGFDACLMSSIEVYGAIAPYARYAVASQEVEPSLGWAYAAFLGHLSDNPGIDGAELARAIVDSYIEQDQQLIDDEARARYVERVYEYSDQTTAAEVVEEELKTITLTAVNLAATRNLLDALDELTRALAEAEQKPVAAARRYAQAFETVFDSNQPKPYIDLGSFARLLEEKTDDPAVQAATGRLIAAIGQAVIDEKHGPDRAGATGVSIYFPNSKLYKDDEAGAESYTFIAKAFAEQSLWDDFLAFHYTKQPLPSRQGQQPPAAPPAADVEAPGAEAITVSPVTLSAKTVTQKKPVILQSTVAGDNVGFIYVFIGYRDPETDAIRVVDMDFLDAEQTREIDGVFYPDWGEGGEIDLEFEWDGQLFAISDGRKSEQALLYPEDYGSSPEEATYTVEGTYTTAKGKKSRRAMLIFSDGELVQVLGFNGNQNTGALREITPRRGDRFTIQEEWVEHGDAEGAEARYFTKKGKTLTFGEDNFTWETVAAPRGTYVVGFIAEDLDGNWYESYETVTVNGGV